MQWNLIKVYPVNMSGLMQIELRASGDQLKEITIEFDMAKKEAKILFKQLQQALEEGE